MFAFVPVFNCQDGFFRDLVEASCHFSKLTPGVPHLSHELPYFPLVICSAIGGLVLKRRAVTRGNGEIYCLVEYCGSVAAASWSVCASLDDGSVLPSRCIELGSHKAVAISPVLDVRINICVTLLDASGITIEEQVFRLGSREAKLRSQINTAFRNGEALAIRNIDELAFFGESYIDDVLLESTGVSEDILEFNVKCFVDSKDCRSVFKPAVLNRLGRPLNDISFTLMGEAVRRDEDYPSFFNYIARYSVNIPADMTDLVIWAQSKNDSVKDGFKAMQGPVTADYRVGWQTMTCPCEIEGERYAKWFQLHKTKPNDLSIQRTAQNGFGYRPKFSVVVPLYHTPVSFFNEMARSVLCQTYDNLELILVNSTPEDGLLSDAIAELSSQDSRVKLVVLEGNRGITENTNAGIEAASGDFISFFDHDDVLEPDLFYWYVKGVNDYPETDLLYCDEDKLEDGKLSWPFFKPDWDELFLETNNYLCHLLTVRKSVLAQIDRPDSSLDGAQDHSMALYIGELARNVYHVRKVLYHWRIHSLSTAANANAKPESLLAGKKAIENHFSRLGLIGEAQEIDDMPHCYRAVLKRVDEAKVLVVPYCKDEDNSSVEFSLSDLTSYRNCEVGFIAAGYGTKEWCQKLAELTVSSNADYVLILDRGIAVNDHSWLTELLGYASRKSIGVVAPKVIYPNGTIRDLGVICSSISDLSPAFRHLQPNNIGSRGLARLAHQVSAVDDLCLLVSKEALLDSAWGSGLCCGLMWHLDLCAAARKLGLYVCVDPSVEVILPERANDMFGLSKAAETLWSLSRFHLAQKWPSLLTGIDPYCNHQMKQDGYYGLSEK